jgi:hypothetical protein
MARSDERRAALQARIEGLHGVPFERVLSEIDYLRDTGDSVIAGGSLAYELGNHLSDLDLVVCGPTTVDSTGVPLEHFIGSLRVDVWKLAQSLIEESFDRAEAALAGTGPLVGAFGDVDHEDELKLMHRMAFGIVLDGDGLKPRPGRDYRTVASRLVVREYAERMRYSALLAQLALRADRPLAAVINARLAVEEALNATVTDRKLPFTGDKWLSERLANQASDLAATYSPFRQLPENPARDALQFVEAALVACTEMWGIDLSIVALAQAARWRNTDLQVLGIGDDRLLVSARAGALWNLDESEADTWQRLVLTGAGESDSLFGLGEGDPDALTLCLHLHENGLLGLGWTHGVQTEDLNATRSVKT